MPDDNERNLWGDVGTIEPAVTPVSILREQARILGELTNHVLDGRVDTFPYQGTFISSFKIAAPAVGDYTYDVLDVKYRPQIYPLQVHDYVNEEVYECASEEAFVDRLRSILQSASLRKAIAVLKAQSD